MVIYRDKRTQPHPRAFSERIREVGVRRAQSPPPSARALLIIYWYLIERQ